jgi:hypothetical protein
VYVCDSSMYASLVRMYVHINDWDEAVALKYAYVCMYVCMYVYDASMYVSIVCMYV